MRRTTSRQVFAIVSEGMMLDRLLAEPVALAELAKTFMVGLVLVFGAELGPDKQAAIVAFIMAACTMAARSQVSSLRRKK